MLTRRTLLATAGAATGAVAGVTGLSALSACDPAPPAPASPTTGGAGLPFDPDSWASVRAQFGLSGEYANFVAFYLASHAASVRAAIERHRAGLDADAHGYLVANEEELDAAARRQAAAYLKTEAGQIAFTDSTTMGLGLLYSGLRLGAGDEVLTTEHDFYSTHESLRLREVRDGIKVRRVRLYDDPAGADAGDIVRRLRAAVTARTRVVAVTWVHSSTGVKLPIRAIADALAAVNRDRPDDQRALLCVDGVHGFGVEDATPAAVGCDFLVSGCHKWLFGPRGTGLVWGSPAGWRRFTPVIPSFSPGDAPGPLATPGGFHSFEHRWALAEAFALHRDIGPSKVAQRTHALATALKDGLAALPKVRVLTPRTPELSAGIVCCEVDGYGPREAMLALHRAKVLTSTTPYDPSYLRFGPSILSSESDVETAVRAVRSM
jgi:selenocysteine lyase/cysteine desulfurase